MEHKTIICNSQSFDKEFTNWKENLKIPENHLLKIISIKHELENHYICYKFKYDDWDDD